MRDTKAPTAPVRPRLLRSRSRRIREAAMALLVLSVLAGCAAAGSATAGKDPSPASAVTFDAVAPDVHQPCGIAPGSDAVWVLACSGKAVVVPSRGGESHIERTIDGELVGIDSISGTGSGAVWVIAANGSGSARRGMVVRLDAISGGATTVDLGSSIPLHAASIDGSLWVATLDGGLFAVDGSSARRLASGLPIVWVVHDGERVWTVAENGTVAERAADGTATKTFPSVLANASAAGAGLGSVWLASEAGIVRFNTATGAGERIGVAGIVNDVELCGGAIWLSQPDFGVRSLDAGGKVVRSIRLDVAPSYLLCDAGRLWVLSQDGKLGSIATG
jgi:hypothetical protein